MNTADHSSEKRSCFWLFLLFFLLLNLFGFLCHSNFGGLWVTVILALLFVVIAVLWVWLKKQLPESKRLYCFLFLCVVLLVLGYSFPSFHQPEGMMAGTLSLNYSQIGWSLVGISWILFVGFCLIPVNKKQ